MPEQLSTKQLQRLLVQHLGGHRLLLVIAVVCFLVAWNRGISLLYGMVALVAALWLACWLMPLLPLRHIAIKARQKGTATIDGKIHIEYSLIGRQPLNMAEIRQQLPFASEAQSQRLLQFVPKTPVVLSANCYQRGEFQLAEVTVGCSWPFGLKTHYRQIPLAHCTLLVEPSTFYIKNMPQAVSRQQDALSHDFESRQLANHEFAALREHRHGDSLRQVNWAASARHQQLMVREYDSFAQQSYVFVMDACQANDIGSAPRSSFEYCVRVAASLMQQAQQLRIPMRLVCGGSQGFDISVGGGSSQQGDFRMALTRARADDQFSYAAAIQQALAGSGEHGTLVIMRNQSQLDQFDPAAINEAAGIIDIRLADESFERPMQKYPEGWRQQGKNHRVLEIHATSDLQRLFRHG